MGDFYLIFMNYSLKAMNVELFNVLAFCVFISHCGTVLTADIQFERIEMFNETYLDGIYNISVLRVSKFNRTVHVFNAEFEFFVDVHQYHEMELSFYFNRLNNNQYNKIPIRVPRGLLCKQFEKFHDVLKSESSEANTNFYDSNGKSCPLKKVGDFNNNFNYN